MTSLAWALPEGYYLLCSNCPGFDKGWPALRVSLGGRALSFRRALGPYSTVHFFARQRGQGRTSLDNRSLPAREIELDGSEAHPYIVPKRDADPSPVHNRPFPRGRTVFVHMTALWPCNLAGRPAERTSSRSLEFRFPTVTLCAAPVRTAARGRRSLPYDDSPP